MDAKFKVRNAFEGLDKGSSHDLTLWHLTRLAAWAFLDQRRRNSRYQAKNAERVGIMMLNCELARRWTDIKSGNRGDELKTLLQMYRECGGPNGSTHSPSPKFLFKRFKREWHRNIIIAFRIVDYLCRIEGHKEFGKAQSTVNFAKIYVEKFEEAGRSKISKAWEQYARAAALIYSLRILLPELTEFKKWEDAWKALERLANDEAEIRQLVGHTAFAAQVLSKTKVRKSFTNSFLGANPIAPLREPFSNDELAIIKSIDSKTLS